MTNLEIGLIVTIVVVFPLIIFKCKIFGHVWQHYVHGRICNWCSKYERNGQWEVK